MSKSAPKVSARTKARANAAAGILFGRLLVFLSRARGAAPKVFTELPTAELADAAAAHVRNCHTIEQAAALLHYPPVLFVQWFKAGERRPNRPEPAPELMHWHNTIAEAAAGALGELLHDLRHAGTVTKKNVKRVDVRAIERLLAALDPERFDQRNVNVRLLRDSMEKFVSYLEDVMGEDQFEQVAGAIKLVMGDVVEST